MPDIKLPYGKDSIILLPEQGLRVSLLSPKMYGAAPAAEGTELVRKALANPIGSPPLRELSAEKKNVVVIASDHTRPVPSKIIMPALLGEIRAGNPDADITILIATGCHRETSDAELLEKFGKEIFENERIVVHDCDESAMTSLGRLPSGGELVINRLAAKADLLVAEGFIEPHFFAGFSGGRKSVLPGVADRSTVLYNHNADFIADEHARSGVLEGNPIQTDMLFAGRVAKLAFICNVVINDKKEILHAVAGDFERAHAAGCDHLMGLCGVSAPQADIVVTTNGGYPLDQNIYQAVKGITTAAAAVREGGVIVMVAKSDDGHGGEGFYNSFERQRDLGLLYEEILNTPADETVIDQWQTQLMVGALLRAEVVYVSDAPDNMVKNFHMHPVHSMTEAMAVAKRLSGKDDPTVSVIPDGVACVFVPK